MSTRILSIDWDYFINTAGDERTYFPDGVDGFSSLSSVIWSGYYTQCNNSSHSERRLLKEIPIDPRLHELITYLDEIYHSGYQPVILVTDSHKHLYPLMLNYFNNQEDITNIIREKEFELGSSNSGSIIDPYLLYHIDFHHDRYSNNLNDYDCGNWALMLEKISSSEYSEIAWVSREDSDKRNLEFNNFFVDRPIDNDISLSHDIKDYFGDNPPDIVFLCKSSIWSPPHLDNYFDMLVDILKQFDLCYYTNNIANRWNSDIKTMIKNQQSLINPFKSSHKDQDK